MGQRGQHAARFAQAGGIDVRQDHARLLRALREDAPPWVDHHRVAMGLAAVRMHAALRGGDDMGQVLDRARAQQRFPVCCAGGLGKCGGHEDQVDVAECPVQFREAQVVADRKPDTAERRVDGDHPRTMGDRALLGILLASVVEAEQVDIVVAGNRMAAVVVDEARIPHLFRVVACERHRAADQPDAMAPRRVGEELLDRTVARTLARSHLVAVAHADDAEVFRQAHQPCTSLDRLGDQRGAVGEVTCDIRTGYRLYRRHPEWPGRHQACRRVIGCERAWRGFDLHRLHDGPSVAFSAPVPAPSTPAATLR